MAGKEKNTEGRKSLSKFYQVFIWLSSNIQHFCLIEFLSIFNEIFNTFTIKDS